MKEYLKLAWRNIWRNKRRTLITIASVFFAMFLSLIMRSMQVGSYGHMADGIVEAFTGFIQVHKEGFWDDQTLDNTFANQADMVREIESADNVKAVIPRLESFALASTGELTKGILVVGIDPVKELDLTHPDKKIKEGKYFDEEPYGVLVSGRLAAFLNLNLKDTLTLLSTGYHGASAAGIYPVTGIVEMPNPELDRRLVFMPLPIAQDFYGAENMLTSLVINVYDSDDLKNTKKDIQGLLENGVYEIMDWKEMNPELVQQIQSDQAGGYIMLGVLYLIVGDRCLAPGADMDRVLVLVQKAAFPGLLEGVPGSFYIDVVKGCVWVLPVHPHPKVIELVAHHTNEPGSELSTSGDKVSCPETLDVLLGAEA